MIRSAMALALGLSPALAQAPQPRNEAAERHQALFRRMETEGEPAAKPKD